MKIHNIFLAGLAGLSLVSCSDYLDVDAPSKSTLDYVYTDKLEMSRALNGVYASLLSNDTYGDAFLTKFTFNTDVDFKPYSDDTNTSSTFQRYACNPDAGAIKKAWDALYQGIERANMLDAGIRNSAIYNEDDAELMQMLGETKVLRAIFYHDLIWYWGDVPFSLIPSYEAQSNVYDVEDRTEIMKKLIADLKWIAPYMQTTASVDDGVKRISKEMAWAMIARMSLTAGGFSLRPSENALYGEMKCPDDATREAFYKDVILYCDSIIDSNSNKLKKPYYQVFVDECNFIGDSGDDVIFEIPFGKEATGNIGYIHGPKMDNSGGTTVHQWGKSSSEAQLNPIYRFLFDEDDSRRDFVNQMFGYDNQGKAVLNNSRSVYNGKWSKLWNTSGIGASTEGKTGINFPYMRYADVLLMSAEAENEINHGPTAKAEERYKMVRERAFRDTNPMKAMIAPSGYEEFKKAVLDERKFEFAGENMRWRDLVRNNLLSVETYWTFFRLYNAAEQNGEYSDAVGMHDFDDSNYYFDHLIYNICYFEDVPNNDPETNTPYISFDKFPQKSTGMNIVRILNLYNKALSTDSKATMMVNGEKIQVTNKAIMSWYDNDNSTPNDYFLNSLYGYIYANQQGQFYINNNGTTEECRFMPSDNPTADDLPVVRYILPYPREIITRSMGKYEFKYGYR